MLLKLLRVNLLILISVSSLFAQQFNKAKLDSFFDVLSQNNQAMGSFALAQNGKIVYKRSVGYASIGLEKKEAANEKSKYRIGSISKMFTATMIFQLVEEQKLSLETKLSQFFPQMPMAEKISIADMLCHRSGLHNFTDDEGYVKIMTKPKTRAELLAIIADGKSDFEPGSKAAYSNSNFVLLGFIVEDLTKQSYQEALKQRICSKIGLKNTYFGSKIKTSENEVYSYSWAGAWLPQPETDMTVPAGAGALVSTPAELTQFIEALFAGKLINEQSLAQMKTLKDNFGMGMFQYPFFETLAYGHTGGIDGFGSMLFYVPTANIAVAYTGNGQVYPINDIVLGAMKIYLNKDYQLPNFKGIQVKSEALDVYLGTYANADMPMKITVTKDGNTLMAQATGQGAFPLEAVDKDKFVYNEAGISLSFKPSEGLMVLKQSGATLLFKKEP